MKPSWHIDPVLLLLFFGMMVFTGILIFVEWRFKDDGQIFQVISSLVAGFAGAFFAKLDPKKHGDTSTTTASVSATPPSATLTTEESK